MVWSAGQVGRTGELIEPPPDLTPEPLPLPGDLRVTELVEPNIGRYLAGRWQVQIYDARTGSWRALVGKDLSGRPAHGRAEPTYATEAAALEYLRGLVRRHQR